jgi:hypothetical protein
VTGVCLGRNPPSSFSRMAASSWAEPSARAPRPSARSAFNTGMSGYQEVLTDPSYAGRSSS